MCLNLETGFIGHIQTFLIINHSKLKIQLSFLSYCTCLLTFLKTSIFQTLCFLKWCPIFLVNYVSSGRENNVSFLDNVTNSCSLWHALLLMHHLLIWSKKENKSSFLFQLLKLTQHTVQNFYSCILKIYVKNGSLLKFGLFEKHT